MPVASIAHRRVVAEEVLGAPYDEVRLTDRNVGAAARTHIAFRRPGDRDLPDEPLAPAAQFTSSPAMRKIAHVSRRRSGGSLVLALPAASRHGRDYQPFW